MPRTRHATPTVATVVETESTADSQSSRDDSQQRPRLTGTLRLRGEPESRPEDLEVNGQDSPGSNNRRIRWAADVVDNEGLGKKSSKVCCIYHKPRAVDESSSSESDFSDSSSSDGDSDSEVDNGDARMANGRRAHHHHGSGAGQQSHNLNHDQSDDDGGQNDSHCHHHHHHHQNSKEKKKTRRKPAPNAYERVPRYNKKQN